MPRSAPRTATQRMYWRERASLAGPRSLKAKTASNPAAEPGNSLSTPGATSMPRIRLYTCVMERRSQQEACW